MKEPTGRMEEELRRSGFGPALDSPFVQRLKGVSFLAMPDLVYDVAYPSDRYTHTVGVAFLAKKLAAMLQLDEIQSAAFVIANILHDVGHAPFSHNSEPFLLEKLGVYHKGMLERMFRCYRKFNHSGGALSHIFRSYSDAVMELSLYALGMRSCGPRILRDLFDSPLNCDKIDGNLRSMALINGSTANPSSWLTLFVKEFDTVAVDAQALPRILEFWNLEKTLYWKFMYTADVFSAEAMLTRALGFALTAGDEIERFVFSTDGAALELLAGNPRSCDLVNHLGRKEFFVPLSTYDHDRFRYFQPQFKSCRFDTERRASLEREVAESLGADPLGVISHFSRRKHFCDTGDGMQLELTAGGRNIVTLDAVNRHLSSFKKSGDFFDIFVLVSPVREAATERECGEVNRHAYAVGSN